MKKWELFFPIRPVFYGIGIFLLCSTICSCSKRKAEYADEEKMLKLIEKYKQAERQDDYPEMHKIAGEMYSFAQKFAPDERGRLMLAGAHVKRGIAYSYQKKRAEAIKELDAAIAISPDTTLVLYAYQTKIAPFLNRKYIKEAREIFAACRKAYEKSKASESFRKNPEFRQSIQDAYASTLFSYSHFLFWMKEYAQAKEVIFNFSAEFESEKDFGRRITYSSAIFFILSQTFRLEKNFEQERHYLDQSFYWAKKGKTVPEYLYLRLAVYETIQGKYEQALAYCDYGLTRKQFLSNRNHAESQAMLLFAKSKIYEQMGQMKTAAEFTEKARKLDSSPHFLTYFGRWWFKKSYPELK